jgi:hypothetical protein
MVPSLGHCNKPQYNDFARALEGLVTIGVKRALGPKKKTAVEQSKFCCQQQSQNLYALVTSNFM